LNTDLIRTKVLIPLSEPCWFPYVLELWLGYESDIMLASPLEKALPVVTVAQKVWSDSPKKLPPNCTI
jgi:hypothetical protein